MLDLMVVDDEKWIRKGVVAKLNKSHLKFNHIYEASNGIEAIKVIQGHAPSIVITDVIMPKMNGIELIKYAKDKYSNIQFVIISGYSEFEYAHQAINLGAKGYILKPITDENLISIIDKIIHEKQPLSNEQVYELDIVGQVQKYIYAHFNEKLTVAGIAEIFSLNSNYLSSLFSRKTGETITKFITKIRIKEACRILIKCNETVYNVSYKVGYDDYQYFHRVFKREKGITPNDFRRRYKSNKA